MSLAQLPYLQLARIQNIQLLNPALASSSLSTDASGNLVGNAVADSGVIPANTITNKSSAYLNSSDCYYVIDSNNRLVFLFININTSDIPSAPAQVLFEINTTAFTSSPSVIPPINNTIINDSASYFPMAMMTYNSISSVPLLFNVYLNNNAGRIQASVGAQWGGSFIPVPSGATNFTGTIIYPF